MLRGLEIGGQNNVAVSSQGSQKDRPSNFMDSETKNNVPSLRCTCLNTHERSDYRQSLWDVSLGDNHIGGYTQAQRATSRHALSLTVSPTSPLLSNGRNSGTSTPALKSRIRQAQVLWPNNINSSSVFLTFTAKGQTSHATVRRAVLPDHDPIHPSGTREITSGDYTRTDNHDQLAEKCDGSGQKLPTRATQKVLRRNNIRARI
ncbi:hypothetical protein FHL15_005157 [Xylaria flabelliformis]|uniref:Uncharacterized protein n=1 Tax=Xylaria flabelliformis TaxID=2512241 RepID=A0A553I1K3_9PEZI|nr:hypothetical protein FHL15_005157 [Xylaria flabelliformis]